MRTLALAALLALPAAGARAEVSTQRTALITLKGRQKQMDGPQSLTRHRFTKKGWITSFSSHVLGAKGERRDADDVFCHTIARQDEDLREFAMHKSSGVLFERLHLTLGDGLNEIRFPAGYGIPVDSGTVYEIESMLHSDDPKTDAAYAFETRMETVEAGSGAPLKDLTDLVVSVDGPGTYVCHNTRAFDIAPGRHTLEKVFTMPYDARVHLITLHAHRYSEEAVLKDAATGEVLWRGAMTLDKSRYPTVLPQYSSAEGLPLKKGARYVFQLTSDNISDKPAEGMAIMRLYIHAGADRAGSRSTAGAPPRAGRS